MSVSMKSQDTLRKPSAVRLGPISLFTIIAVLCLATLSVLSIVTANASLSLSKMQAQTVSQQYQAEATAQEFLSLVCSNGSVSSESVAAAAQKVQASTNNAVTVNASESGTLISAQFMCASGRVLDTQFELGAGGSYRIIKWRLIAKVNIAETETLWSGM